MWDMVSEYQSHGITARSFKTKEGKIEGDFDIGIFFGSYESRTLESSKLLGANSCKTSIIIFFMETDKRGFRKKYDKEILKQVSICSSREPNVVSNRSINNVQDILNAILKIIPFSEYSEDKKWFIDTSSSPKPYFLGLLAYLRDKVFSPRITMFNSTAQYEKSNDPQEAFSFTEGFGQYIWMPWLWGRPDPRLPWTYLFLLGFEGDRSLGTYDIFEPDRVKAVISDPGYQENYPNEAKARNRQFLEEVCPEILYTNAGDAVETWVKIDKFIAEDRSNSNICFVPLGPKPHSIGACLSALTDGSPAIMYLMPKSHKIRDVPRGEFVWRYEIKM